MGRRDIADYLGLTLETVSRGLSALRDEGILSFIGQTGRKIALQDRSKLARYAMSSEPTSNPERTIWSVYGFKKRQSARWETIHTIANAIATTNAAMKPVIATMDEARSR
jgi:DNA-binding transcriptional regulator YhcF (GntR family)